LTADHLQAVIGFVNSALEQPGNRRQVIDSFEPGEGRWRNGRRSNLSAVRQQNSFNSSIDRPIDLIEMVILPESPCAS
jgi:hypothetical protein